MGITLVVRGTAVQATPQRHSRGVVLLSVLLIVALLSAVTVRLVSRHSLHVAQASNSLGTDLTLNYAIGAETFARQLLHEDWESGGAGVDHFEEIWAMPLAPFPLEEYANAFMEIQLVDLSGCFNLNSLGGSAAAQNQARLKNLLRSLSLPEEIADAWLDWVDPDETVSGFGAEDSDYLLQEPAYRTANRLAGDLSEIRLLAGLEPESLETLLPHICVLPVSDLQINVNTAGAEVLSALQLPAGSDSGGAGAPRGGVGNRGRAMPITPITLQDGVRTFAAVNEFTSEYPEMLGAVDVLAVSSDYFEVQARVQIDGNVTELASIVQRDSSSGTLKVISRNLGKKFRSRLLKAPS